MLKIRLVATWIAGALVLTTTGIWALQSSDAMRGSSEAIPVRSDDSRQELVQTLALNQEAFSARLWNTAKREVATEREQQQDAIPAPGLELVSIIQHGHDLRAALYDRAANKLLILSQGEQVAGQTVKAIHPGQVELTDGQRTTMLKLREENS